jgi:tetratricopeptide (TPR) repeat protein
MRLLPLLLLLLLPALVSGQNKKDKQLYAAYITSGDSAFNAKNYSFAKDKYKLAAAIKPKEAYPADRMALCDKMAVEQGVEYKKWIVKADSCFMKQDYATAKMYYLKANTAKPTETYASDQAKNCNYQLVAKQAMEDVYKEQLRKADSCYAAKSWSCAKANYEAASRTKPEQEFPKQRIKECEQKITPAVNTERYDITISDADRQYDAGNYARAKELYQEALQFNPGAKYALERIKLCEEKSK